jgi:hypothetical protein
MADQELKRSGLLELIRTEEIQELYDANEKLMGSKSLRNMDKMKRNIATGNKSRIMELCSPALHDFLKRNCKSNKIGELRKIEESVVAALMCSNSGTTMADFEHLYEVGEVKHNRKELVKATKEQKRYWNTKLVRSHYLQGHDMIDDMLIPGDETTRIKELLFAMGTKPTNKESQNKKTTVRKYEDHQDLRDCLNEAMTEVKATKTVSSMIKSDEALYQKWCKINREVLANDKLSWGEAIAEKTKQVKLLMGCSDACTLMAKEASK